MLDPSNPAHMQGLEKLMALEGLTRPDAKFTPEDWIEPCTHVLARTTDEALVTDDNMGTEWQSVWGRR